MLKKLAIVAAYSASACNESSGSVEAIVRASNGAELVVEVQYAGGATEADADALLETIELLPAREAFPELDLTKVPASHGAELSTDEPSFAVLLHPLDEAAKSERFAWRARPPLLPDTTVPGGFGEVTQGLEVDAGTPIYKYLAPGETWRTALYRCYAPFGFAAMFTGTARACADMGYESKAGSRCGYGFDPREPVVVVHDGIPDDYWKWSPLSEHWFRGRVTGGLYGTYGTPAVLHAWGVVCL